MAMATTAISATSALARKTMKELFDWNKDCCISNLSALWEDNRESVFELLSSSGGSNSEYPADKQNYLIFADESLSNLILRNVLKDPTEDSISSVAAAMKKKKKAMNPSQQQQQQQQNLFPPNANVIGTHILSSTTTSSTSFVPTNDDSSLLFDNTEISTSISPASIELFSNNRRDSNPFSDDYNNYDSTANTYDDDNVLVKQHVFFLRPTTSHTRLVAHTIIQQLVLLKNKNKSININNNDLFRLVFIPYCTALCEQIFWDILSPYEEKLFSNSNSSNKQISITQLHLDLIPLEKDLLSMEIPFVLKDCDVHGIPSASITAVARSILKLQDLSTGGIIPRICGVGPLAEAIVDKLFSLRLQEYMIDEDDTVDVAAGFDLSNDTTTEINALLILDRKVDLVTPMLTPLTYEGLIDDIIGIDTGYVQVDESIVDPDDTNDNDDDGKSKSSNYKKKSSSNPFDDDNDDDDQQKEHKKINEKSTGKRNKVALALNGSDPLFAEVRTQHVEKFGSFLQDQAKALRESHTHFTSKQDLEVIHQFVKQIPLLQQNLRSLTLQIHLAEIIKRTTDGAAFQERWHTERSMVEGDSCYDTLEDLISNSSTISGHYFQHDDEEEEKGEDWGDDQSSCLRFLRLLCLQSVTSGGIKSSKFDSLRREVIHRYGYETLFLLNNLEKLGALRRRETSYFDASSSSFSNLRKYLNLISDVEVNNHDPDDISYVSSGYAPLSVRLIEAISSGWAGLSGGGSKEEVLKELQAAGGGTRFINVVQRYPPEDLSQAMKKPPKSKGLEDVVLLKNKQQKKPVLVVFFVGGVTFMEIAALRLLTKKATFPYQILCCTTKVMNGNSFISALN